MTHEVDIVYREDVPATIYSPGHIAGERFTVKNAAAAKLLHPQADIVRYANGQPFDEAHDESMRELKAVQKEARDAEKAARDAEKAERLAKEAEDRDAAKAARADARKAAKATRTAQDAQQELIASDPVGVQIAEGGADGAPASAVVAPDGDGGTSEG